MSAKGSKLLPLLERVPARVCFPAAAPGAARGLARGLRRGLLLTASCGFPRCFSSSSSFSAGSASTAAAAPRFGFAGAFSLAGAFRALVVGDFDSCQRVGKIVRLVRSDNHPRGSAAIECRLRVRTLRYSPKARMVEQQNRQHGPLGLLLVLFWEIFEAWPVAKPLGCHPSSLAT